MLDDNSKLDIHFINYRTMYNIAKKNILTSWKSWRTALVHKNNISIWVYSSIIMKNIMRYLKNIVVKINWLILKLMPDNGIGGGLKTQDGIRTVKDVSN